MPCSFYGARGLKLPWKSLWALQDANKHDEGMSIPQEAVSMMLCMDGNHVIT